MACGLIQHIGEVIGAFDQLVVAGHARKQRGLVDAAALPRTFLQAATPENVGRGFAGNHNHRQFVGVGVGNAGNQIACTGACGGNARTNAPANPRITTRHEGRALLVLDQHRLDAGVVEVVVHRQNVRTGHPENRIHPQLLQEFNDELADLNLHERLPVPVEFTVGKR